MSERGELYIYNPQKISQCELILDVSTSLCCLVNFLIYQQITCVGTSKRRKDKGCCNCLSLSGMARNLALNLLLIATLVGSGTCAQIPSSNEPLVSDVRIECRSSEMLVSIKTQSAFNGMVYPKGLSKNSTCMAEFLQEESPVRYKLPLRSCNTMSTDLIEGGVEYFNTIVVQPHRKLVTNQGRGFHIRCRYQTRDKTITSHVNVSMLGTTPLTATAPMPGCTMKIFYGDPTEKEVAENVKIGDPLSLVISIDEQEIYGMKITDCLVRDGLGWGEQRLINSDGCPDDGEIMGQFVYSNSLTTASVHFQAHKFPYTSSVYYQCNVRLCIRDGGGCEEVPPNCEDSVNSVRKRRRRAESNDEEAPATIEVFSGLYVNEATDLGTNDLQDEVTKEKTNDDPNSICISQKNFAIGIAIAGLILMLAVIAAILILISKRRRKKDASTTGSSIYSGPYTNTAYSHSS